MKRKRESFRFCLAIVAVAFFSVSLVANSQTDDSGYILKKIALNHKDASIYKCFHNDLSTPLNKVHELKVKKKATFYFKKHENYRIYLIDYNPFLYQYKWKGVTKTKIVDISPLQQFIDTLTAQGVEDVKPADTEEEKVDNKAIPAFQIEKLSKKLPKEYPKFKLSDTDVQLYSESVAYIRQYSKDSKEKIEYFNEEGEWTRKQLVEFVKTWKPEHAKRIREFYKKTDKEQDKFIEYFSKNIKTVKIEYQQIYTYLSFVQDQKTPVLALIQKIESIISAVNKMENEELLLGEVEYEKDNILTAHIEIEKIDKRTKGKKIEGKIDVSFMPHKTFRYMFGFTQVFSTFKTTDEETGKEMDSKLQVPVLTITLNSWWEDHQGIKVGLQLGLTVDDNIYHALIGPAFFLNDWLLFGGGLHYRIGGEFDKHFGGYFNVGINFGGKSKK
jgi:hypothetical protein